MIKILLIKWFKNQASKFAKEELKSTFNKVEIEHILHGYWQRYLRLKNELPAAPTMGGSLMLNLSAMSVGFYQELTSRGIRDELATCLFYDIAWPIYKKMGKIAWTLAGIRSRSEFGRLLRATQLFREFPFNDPSYIWKDVKSNENIVAFDCEKCLVADYFQAQGFSKFCANTWCELDHPLAKLWNAKLERTGSIAGGAKLCDFRWKIDSSQVG